MSMKQGLGKGIGALIPKELIKPDQRAQQAIVEPSNETTGIALIDIEKIVRTNPVQPRTIFEEGPLKELAASIAVHGVITPITVRKLFDGYELISGERRLRASKLAGLTKIPAYILDVNSDAEMLEIAIVENVQREDLNPLEVAVGYQRLMEECGLRQEDVAAKVGKDRSTVSNMLRLLRLPSDVQIAVRDKKVSMGHARALLALSTEVAQAAVLREILSRDLSVRKTEALVKDIELGRKDIVKSGEIRSVHEATSSQSSSASNLPKELAATLGDIENSLRHLFATQVRVKMKGADEGAIEVEFYSLDELERIIDMLASLEGSNS